MLLNDNTLAMYNGIIDPEQLKAIQGRSNLDLALGLLSASGPSTTPTNFGQVLASGLKQQREGQQAGLQNAIALQDLKTKAGERQSMMEIGKMLNGATDAAAKADAYRRVGDFLSSRGQVDQASKYYDIADKLVPKRENVFDKIKPADYTKESLSEFEQTGNYGVLVAKEKKDPQKFEGAYGNLALAMFGTKSVDDLNQDQRTTLDAEARKRGLERPPSTSINLNMPSESERTAGFLTQRLMGGLKSLASATGQDPTAASPNLGAEAVKKLTGSEMLKNLANSSNRQQVEAAQLEILDSALTLGTGAAYTREQLENYRQTYFPQIGDSPNTIRDKQERLSNLLSASKIKSGRATPDSVGLPQGVTVKKVQ